MKDFLCLILLWLLLAIYFNYSYSVIVVLQ